MVPLRRWLLAVVVILAATACGAAVGGEPVTCSGIVPAQSRGGWVSLASFGAIGDGRTDNTAAFAAAVAAAARRGRHLSSGGVGTLLYVPAGVWVTSPFNLTSHLTLFLSRDAVIKATQDTESWPVVDPLPSYGRGRELPGGRFMSFIHGRNLQDVVITGENGTIDGQGEAWWNMWRQGRLKHTRPHLLELVDSTDVVISNVVFQNSPFWNIHPVYCSNVVVRYVTVLAPRDSPNTDGVDPDSSSNVCIEDSYFSTGDDLVAIKSGWDQFGIAYGRPSSSITVRRITGSTPFAGFAVGSETSGGVENILAEDLQFVNSGLGVHIKTNTGRGGFIRNVTVAGVTLEGVRIGVRIAGDVGSHADDNYDRDALPAVSGLTIRDVQGAGVEHAGVIKGIKNDAFTGVCLSNVTLSGGAAGAAWQCRDVSGSAVNVQPPPCAELAATAAAMNFCRDVL